MAEPVTQTPAQGVNEQDIQLITKKLAYIAIQFQKTAERIWGDFARCDDEGCRKLRRELDLARDYLPEIIWRARKAVIRLTDPNSTQGQREYAEANLPELLAKFDRIFKILLDNCIREERKQKYLQLAEEFHKAKEMIKKTVLS
ncbi:hypothetical protein STSV1pORF4 [Sulfolobus virus STSV1]|uniref:hypothetical protein n=1 Tax=Sulfolobus virus STSV1 TaxID=285013 RepID=UPI000042B0F2|nr:hypothetical protein STSV1pORF4 [Sulfolobus virus STSV1]CAH04187.1 hypothetical protein [Sulfolobus virus STSV1]